MSEFFLSLGMVEQTSNDIVGVFFIILCYSSGTIYSIFNREYGISVIMLSITLMYSFLKLFDLTGLFPSYLWILFNFIQFLLIMFLIKICCNLGGKVREMSSLISKLKK